MTAYPETTFAGRRALPVTPDRATAERLAREYQIIPIYQELHAGTLAPLALYTRLSEPDEPSFLLESAPVSGGATRYSYIGYRPRPVDLGAGDPIAVLREVTGQRFAPVPGLPRFRGGVVGYLGYEVAGHFERLPSAAKPAPGMPDAAFLAADDLAIVDHAAGKLLLLTMFRPAEESYSDALARIDHLRALLADVERPPPSAARPAPPPAEGVASGRPPAGWRSNVTRTEFESMVRAAREYIAAGDAFQIVLSQRFSKPLRADPLELYRHLRAVNPSPYMYHLGLGGGRHVVGASPELLVSTHGRRVETRPLAGTRHRGADQASDLALERELLADEKERAEHVMLVDLGRHDIGRVTVPGTVRVDQLMRVERYSHVMHISSTVSGRLTTEATCLDALRSTFPAGTLSGAPKIRAMEIIAELEPERRGIYGGTVGYVGYCGDTDMAIGLRTMVVADGQVHVQAGAGVVADSDPAAEYQETLHKANALFTAVRQAECGHG